MARLALIMRDNADALDLDLMTMTGRTLDEYADMGAAGTVALVHFVKHSKATGEQPVPDVVLSLLGAGEPVAEDDINAREAYYQYLEEKYK